MRLLHHSPALSDRLTWQAASLLLAYPDVRMADRLRTVDEFLVAVHEPQAELLARTAAALGALDPMRAASTYVDTFDLDRRCTMYLTYWTAGDTRNRGKHMLAFAEAYRNAGVERPPAESPDHLAVVLEFAATVDPAAGRRLLVEHRVSIDVLWDALTALASPYAHAVAAVRATLPASSAVQERRARLLADAGPPTESVGLQPFTLTVPPRRSAEGG